MTVGHSYALLVIAIITCGAVQAATSTPAGNPHLDVAVSTTGYNQTDIAVSIAAWLKANSNLARFGSAINSTAVFFYDSTAVAPKYFFNVTVTTVGITNVDQWYAMQSLRTALLAGSVLSNTYTVNYGFLHENPATTVYISLSPMTQVYQYHTSPVYTISLSAAPRVNRNVTIFLAPVASSVSFNLTKVVIAWPMMSAGFTASAGAVVTTCGVSLVAIKGSDTPSSRFQADTTFNTYSMKVIALETATVSPASSTSRLYAGRQSPTFTITVPRHRDATFDLVVTPVFSPAVGLTANPVNVTISSANSPATFYVTGTVGVYTVSYWIGQPYTKSNGLTAGANNFDFNQITTTSTITILKTMNASSSSIPDAYMVAPYYSAAYGGAYSQLIPFVIERDPVAGTTLTVTPSSSSTIEFTPASITFVPGGTTRGTFFYRAAVIGIHTITYTLTGTGAGDYYMNPPTRRWFVRGRNQGCYKVASSTLCFSTPGCNWNANRSLCSNGTLPIAMPKIPLLFDGERSVQLNFSLPTPVRTSLTITFFALSRLVFTPPTLTLPAGQSVGNFSITGTLLNGDTQALSLPFQLLLSGASANMYTQEVSRAILRPLATCVVSAPANAFFVMTLSDVFQISCDTPPETEVIFTPVPSLSGVAILPQVPISGYPNAVVFAPGQTIGYFYANSTTTAKGVSALRVTIGGVNKARYAPITATQFRVIASGVVNLPPAFHMTAYSTSANLNLDLSVAPPAPLNVSVFVFQNGTDLPANINITVNSSLITFNRTMRATINVTARAPGWYYLNFSIAGAYVRNYMPPTERVIFEVQDPLDGAAFTARIKPGYLPNRKKCRISVGLQSTVVKGQDPVALPDEFCNIQPTVQVFPNQTYPCNLLRTEERCQNVLAVMGHACVWNIGVCEFLPVMQGNIAAYAYGSGFTVFLNKQGEVWTIGQSAYGQLGHYNTTVDKVPLPESIAVVTAGTSHVMVLSGTGNVYTWGANQNGQLGLSTRTQHLTTPSMVSFPSGENITCISSGTLHNAALSLSGRLYMWGSNQYGQLGTAAQYRGYANSPIQLGRDVFGGDAVIAVTLGEFHSMAATSNGAYTWGSNIMGQLGRDGYDDYVPKAPVLWVKDRWSTAPTYASYLLGRDC